MEFTHDPAPSFYSGFQQPDTQPFPDPPFEQQQPENAQYHNPGFVNSQPGQHHNETPFQPPNQPPNQQNGSRYEGTHSPESTHTTGDYPQFDIFEWYPRYQSCQRYFLERAQHSGPVQAVAAFINIRLPFTCGIPGASNANTQRHAASNSQNNHSPQNGTFSFSVPNNSMNHQQAPPVSSQTISLIPYLRRLVVTGLDFPGVLHGFFGDDWAAGIGPLHEQERRNYMFAAKSGGWASVKRDYDVGIGGGGGGSGGGSNGRGSQHPTTGMAGPSAASGGGMMINDETVPFMRQLQNPKEAELRAAEKAWSEWLLMEDWLIGPRAPAGMREGQAEGEGNVGRDEGEIQSQTEHIKQEGATEMR